MHKINQVHLSIAAMLSVFVAVIIYVISLQMFDRDIKSMLFIIAGMLSAATASSLANSFKDSNFSKANKISFDEGRARQTLDAIIDAEYSEVRPPAPNRSQVWEPTAGSLLEQDPTLALAKLRIDLERELRRIAYSQDLPLDPQRFSISSLLRTFVKRDILEKNIIMAIQDVLPICNAAIHGAEVKYSVAVQALEIGNAVVGVLKTYPKHEKIDESQPIASMS